MAPTRRLMAASFISLASFGIDGRSWSVTFRHCSLAASASSWAKAVAMKAETTRHPALACMGKRIAHEVDAAALPACGQHLRRRSLDALVGIGDRQLDATQPAPPQLAQEL